MVLQSAGFCIRWSFLQIWKITNIIKNYNFSLLDLFTLSPTWPTLRLTWPHTWPIARPLVWPLNWTLNWPLTLLDLLLYLILNLCHEQLLDILSKILLLSWLLFNLDIDLETWFSTLAWSLKIYLALSYTWPQAYKY